MKELVPAMWDRRNRRDLWTHWFEGSEDRGVTMLQRFLALCSRDPTLNKKTTLKPNSLKQQPFILLRHKQFGQGFLAGMACSCSMEHQSGQLTEGWEPLPRCTSLHTSSTLLLVIARASAGAEGWSLRFCLGGPLHMPGRPHSTMVYFPKGVAVKRETRQKLYVFYGPTLDVTHVSLFSVH